MGSCDVDYIDVGVRDELGVGAVGFGCIGSFDIL
jgi:hypothetical protein